MQVRKKQLELHMEQQTGSKWNAYITFQKKWHFLGGFKEKSQAVQARKHGEHHFHDPVISEFWNNLTEQTKQKYLENQGAER